MAALSLFMLRLHLRMFFHSFVQPVNQPLSCCLDSHVGIVEVDCCRVASQVGFLYGFHLACRVTSMFQALFVCPVRMDAFPYQFFKTRIARFGSGRYEDFGQFVPTEIPFVPNVSVLHPHYPLTALPQSLLCSTTTRGHFSGICRYCRPRCLIRPRPRLSVSLTSSSFREV